MIQLLSEVSIIMNILAFLWLLCALIIILVILIQKGRGGGLSGAFGGGGGAGGILGSKTGDFLTWVTVTLVGVFLLLSIVLAKFYKPRAASEESYAPTSQAQAQPEIPETSGLPDETGLESEVNIPE